MLNRKYLEISSILAEKIKSGEYPVFRRIPSETALMRRFGVSRGTIRHALSELERLRLVNRRRGCGTFVRRQRGSGAQTKLGIIVTGEKYARQFPLLSGELLRLAGADGFELLFENTFEGNAGEQRERIRNAFTRMTGEGVSGIIYQPLVTSDQFNLQLTEEHSVPIVVVGGEIRTKRGMRVHDTVDVDWFDAGRALADRIRRKGVRSALFLMGSPMYNAERMRLGGMESEFGENITRICSKGRNVRRELSRALVENPEVGAIVAHEGTRIAEIREYLAENRQKRTPPPLLTAFDDFDNDELACGSWISVRGSSMDLVTAALQRLIMRLKDPSVKTCAYLLPATFEIRESGRKNFH